jgi:hypothetical protein
MSMSIQRARVVAAEQRMRLARTGVALPAAALLDRGERYPFTMLGLAAAVGAVLGRFTINPLRIPGVSLLFGGGLAEVTALGARMIAGFGSSLDRGDSSQP